MVRSRRSSSRERGRSRHRRRSRSRSHSRGRKRRDSRSRSRVRERRGRERRTRSRSRSPGNPRTSRHPASRNRVESGEVPLELNSVHQGCVATIKEFGAFIQLDRHQKQGLCHGALPCFIWQSLRCMCLPSPPSPPRTVSELVYPEPGTKAGHPKDYVCYNQRVFCKIIGFKPGGKVCSAFRVQIYLCEAPPSSCR